MSKMIDALNRLQSMRSETPSVETNESPSSSLTAQEPSVPVVTAQSQSVDKGIDRPSMKPGNPSPQLSSQFWFEIVQKEYLQSFVLV